MILESPTGSGSRVSPGVLWDAASQTWQMWINTNLSGGTQKDGSIAFEKFEATRDE